MASGARRSIPIATVLVLLTPGMTHAETLAGSPASADTADAVAAARVAFQDGIELGRLGRWAEALSAFERSSRLRPHAATTYNHGFCELSLGRYTRAKRDLVEALGARDADGAEELPPSLRTSAGEYLAQLEPLLARLELHVDPEGALVSIDGAPLELLPGGMALAGTRERAAPEAVPAPSIVIELDPGAHVVSVSVDGGVERTTRLTLSSGMRQALALSAEPKAPPSPAPDPMPAPIVAPAHAAAEPPSRMPALVAFGAGALGLVVGAGAGTYALVQRGQVGDECPGGVCPPGEPTRDLRAANTAATVATVGFSVAAVAAAAGGVLWWTSTPRDPVTAGRVGVFAGVGSAGVRGTF